MNTIDFLTSVRYKANHNDFTEYQITDALNYVMGEINKALNSVTSSLTQEIAVLPLVDSQATLPANLESIIKVDSKVNIPITDELSGFTYQIVGNTIRSQGDSVKIYYRKSFPTYSFDGTVIAPSTIDLPTSFKNMLVDNVLSRISGQPSDIQADTIRLIANRDGRKRPQRLIFEI